MDDKPPVNLKREVSYQYMRTLRALCFPIATVAIFVGGIYGVNAFMNSLRWIQLFMFWLTDMPMPTVMHTMFSEDMPLAQFNLIVIKQMVYSAIGLTVYMVGHACFIPYNTQPNMPTYKIRHCQGCGAAIANHNVYSCPTCGCKLPSGFGLAAIRTYGYLLTFATFGLMGLLVLILL